MYCVCAVDSILNYLFLSSDAKVGTTTMYYLLLIGALSISDDLHLFVIIKLLSISNNINSLFKRKYSMGTDYVMRRMRIHCK